MLIRYGYEITVTCAQPTPMVCLLSVSEDRKADIRVAEKVFTTPIVPTTTYIDTFGNHCRRLVAPPGDLTMWGDATIEDDGKIDPANFAAVEVPVAELPDSCLLYLMGSRYCETDKLSQAAWDLFGNVTPGWGRVQAVCDFVHARIKFDYMQARATRTAFEAFEERVGVCRDFAHLAVTLCRCLNIPARYINGHLGDIGVPVVDPMDFSAWIEVFLDGSWWTFDPRNNMPRIGRIVVARGRDAADIPLINSFGPHVLKSFRVWTYEVFYAPTSALTLVYDERHRTRSSTRLCAPRSQLAWALLLECGYDLSLADGEDDRLLTHCFGGCTFEAIISALVQYGYLDDIDVDLDVSRVVPVTPIDPLEKSHAPARSTSAAALMSALASTPSEGSPQARASGNSDRSSIEAPAA